MFFYLVNPLMTFQIYLVTPWWIPTSRLETIDPGIAVEVKTQPLSALVSYWILAWSIITVVMSYQRTSAVNVTFSLNVDLWWDQHHVYVSHLGNTLSSESSKYSVSPCVPLKWIFDVFFFLYHHSSLSAVSWEWGEAKSRYNSCCSPGCTSHLWACSFAFLVICKRSREDWDQPCRGL